MRGRQAWQWHRNRSAWRRQISFVVLRTGGWAPGPGRWLWLINAMVPLWWAPSTIIAGAAPGGALFMGGDWGTGQVLESTGREPAAAGRLGRVTLPVNLTHSRVHRQLLLPDLTRARTGRMPMHGAGATRKLGCRVSTHA